MLVPGGTSLANHHVIHALTQFGGPVVTEFPVYDCISAAVRVSRASNALECGSAAAVRIQRLPERNFQIVLAEWTAMLATARPRLVVLSNPHNPSCVALENMPELLAAVDAHNAGIRDPAQQCYVLVDEVIMNDD